VIRGIGVVRVECQVPLERFPGAMQCALLFALIVYRLIFLNGEGDRPIVIRPDFECGFIVFRSLLMMAPTCKELGEPVMRLEVPRIQPQRALEGVLRAQVIGDELEHIAPGDVSLGQLRRESDCAIRRSDRVGGSGARHEVALTQKARKDVRHSRLCVGELRIECNGATK